MRPDPLLWGPLSAAEPNKIVGKVGVVAGESVFTLTIPVRDGASFGGTTERVSARIDGLVYHVCGSTDLVSWNLVVTELTGADVVAIQAGLPALTAGWSYRTFRAPGTTATHPRTFLRSVVELY